MNRLLPAATTLIAVALAQGCASSRPHAQSGHASARAVDLRSACVGDECSARVLRVAHSTEVPEEKDAPAVPGHPMTSVVVTQCNLIVAVYLTMPDGKLLRFDNPAAVPADQLVQMAYTATRSERVEVSCNDAGVVGYERHDPT